MTDSLQSRSVHSSNGSSQKITQGITEADVRVTAELAIRPTRQPDLAVEIQVLQLLAQQLVDDPQAMLKTLVGIVLDRCQCGTVGVSLLEPTATGESVFRWVAIAGALADSEHTIIPGDFSPCGTALRTNQPQLYAYPERYFTYLQHPQFPIVEEFLMPLCVNHQPLGTLWLLSHDEARRFDSQDQRLITSFVGFTAAALQSMQQRQTAENALQREQEAHTEQAQLHEVHATRTAVALHQSQEFNQQILDSSDDCLKVLDLEGRILHMNQRGQALIGIQDLTLLLNHSWVEFWQGVDRQAALNALNTAKAGGVGNFQGYCPILAGEPKWWDVKLTPIRGADGQIEQVLCISRDITERRRIEDARKQAEERLRESEKRLSAIFSQATVGLSEVSLDGQFQQVNDKLCRFLGRSRQEMLAASVHDVTYPEDMPKSLNALEHTLETGEPVSLDKRYRHPDGTIVWANSSLIRLDDEQGCPRAILAVTVDLSARKQAELERQRSDALLQGFLSASPIALALLDRELHFLYANEALAQINGISLSGHLGRTLWEVLPQMARQWAPMLLRIMETQQPVLNLEFNGEVRPGVFRNTIANYYPVCLPNGEVIGVGAAVMDVSALTQAQQELRESEERFRTLADNISQLAWMADAHGWIFWYNQRWFDYTGTTLEEMQGWGWQQVHHPDHVERVVKKFRHCVETGDLWEDTFPLRGKDEQYRWFLSRAIPVRDEQGNILRWLGTNTDITEREQLLANERHYANQLQGLTSAALAINSALSVEEVLQVITDQAASIVGAHQSVTSMTIDQKWAQAINAVHLSDKYAQWRDYAELPDGSGIYASVCHLNRPMRMSQAELEAHPRWKGFGKGAGKHPLMRGWLAAPLVGRDGNNIGLIQLSDKYAGEFTPSDESILIQLAQMASIAVENARLYEAEQQARTAAEASREEAQAANRVKDEFLAVLSHELRSPLNPILGWSTLLQKNKLDAAKTAQALATIQRNAKLQSELIEDLLDVSRILRGKLSFNVAPVNLVCTIRAAMETVRLAAEAKSIKLEASLEPDVGLVSGDATRIQQVIWNLLSNAVKFTPPGGQVTIRLEPQDTHAQITVSDTGQGIAPDFLPYVFDYFRQANAKTTRKFGGLGLGLAIVRHLVELHGGTVRVESPGEGQGATFVVRLPLMPTSSKANQDQRSLEQYLDLNGIKILVVDDDIDTRELVAFLLEQEGAQVTAVSSAHEALLVLTQSEQDVLLSDIGMPDMDGYMLIQQVRALLPHGGQIPAIALTAYAGDINQQQVIAAGFQKHISKPIEPQVLVQEIADLVRSTQAF